MAIRKPTPPRDVVDAFLKQLPQFVWQSAETVFQRYVGDPKVPLLQELGQLEDPDLIHDPQPLFLLGLREIAENTGVKAAKPAGWRFFAGRRAGAILMGKLSIRIPSEGWKLTAGNYGDRTWEVYQATLALDQLPQVKEADYELRVLVIPGLNLEGFWLVAQPPKPGDPVLPDLAVPFPGMPDQPNEALQRAPVYTLDQFLATIRPLAQLRLTAESKYGG